MNTKKRHDRDLEAIIEAGYTVTIEDIPGQFVLHAVTVEKDGQQFMKVSPLIERAIGAAHQTVFHGAP